MGKLILISLISSVLGMLGIVRFLDSGTGNFWVLFSIITNVITVIYLIYKARRISMRLRTSQIVYACGVIAVTIGWVLLIPFRGSNDMSGDVRGLLGCLLSFVGASTEMITLMWCIGASYLVLYLKYGDSYFVYQELFLPDGENREIKKHLRTMFATVGSLLLIFAVIAFVVGWSDSRGAGAAKPTECYKCDGYGRYNRKGVIVPCDSCGGSGVGIYREDGENTMGRVAFWAAAAGVGALTMTKIFKEE